MKYNFLLVMPRFVTSSELGYFFSLGLPYVSASMKKEGFSVCTLNLNHREGSTFDILRKNIIDNDIHVLLTGGLSPQYSIIRDVIENARKIRPSLIILVGGGIVSSDPETAMTALEYADYGVIGEGEATSCAFGAALEQGADMAGVDGLIYKNKDGIYRVTPLRAEIKDMNTIPWPDYEGFEFEKAVYNNPSTNGLNLNGVLHMILSRSCPFNCTFCFHTTGRKYRQRSLDDFFAELDFMLKKYPVKYLSLVDDLFAHDEKRIREFCLRIKGYGINWDACFRVDEVNEHVLRLLKESGCNFMTFGLESAENSVLESMKKGITVEGIEQALKLVHDNGVHFMGAFIFGDKKETFETAMKTIAWWQKYPEYPIVLSRIITYPGTDLYKYACEKGIIRDKVKFLREGCPHVNVSRMTDEELAMVLKKIADVTLERARPLDGYEFFNIDYIKGTLDVKGRCRKCSAVGTWDAIQIFRPNFLGCPLCGESHTIEYPLQFYENIERHLKCLESAFGKIAIWCMSIPFQKIVMNSKAIKAEGIYLVDISEISQGSSVFGKTVYSPAVINARKIPLVICTLPAYQSTIEKRVAVDHPHVAKVLALHRLCDPHFADELEGFFERNACLPAKT